MKFLIRIALPVLACVVLLVPGGIGYLAQPELRTLSELLDQQIASHATATQSRLTRDWFRSTYDTTWRVHDAELGETLRVFAGQPPGLDEPLLEALATLHHGPLPLTAPGRGGLLPAAGTVDVTLHLLDGDQRKRLPANAYARFGLGSVNATVLLEPLHALQVDATSTLSIDGGALTLKANRDMSSLAAGVDLAALTISRVVSGDHDLEISDIAVRADSKTAAERTHLALKVDVGAATLLGNDSDGTRLALACDVNRRELQALIALLGALPRDTLQANAALTDALTRLAASGMSLRLDDVYVGTPQGAATARLDASLPAGDDDPMSMLRRASGSASLAIPVELADALAGLTPDGDTQFRTVVAAGFLRIEGDRYVSDLVYDRGKLEINGFPMPLPF